MPKFSLWAVLAALALPWGAGVAAAQGGASRTFPVATVPELVDHYPDRRTLFPGGVTGLADVVYSTLPGYRPLIVDLYLPAGPPRARPLILYIHGGGWVGGHTRHAGALADFPNVLASLAAEGFVVASLEYRLSGEAPFPAALQDARAAVRFLKANAGKYGVDPSRVGVWGGSAGGHLASLVATSCGVTSLDPAPQPAGSECVQAAAIWYGVFDVAPMATAASAAPNRFLGCETCAPYQVSAASPVTYIDRGDPPFLLIHGEEDKTVPVTQSRDAERRLKAAGVPVEAIYIAGVDHSFIAATPEGTRAATLRATNATFDFFHKAFGVPR
jgi:acetyl esterase/lipase